MHIAVEIPSFEDPSLSQRIAGRWNNLTKPLGSLGQLEDFVLRFGLIRGEALPQIRRKAMFVFCADHGVAEESVSPFPQEITRQMVRNYLDGGAAINVLCRHYGIEAQVVDCGVKGAPEPNAVDRRVGNGTANFTRGPAMSREQAERALANGIELARVAAGEFELAGVGEMGIGNTTAASALLCALGGFAPSVTAGRGAGLDDAGVLRKVRVLEAALRVNAPDPSDPVGVLAAVGGFEIATMAGFLLGAPAYRLPVVVDGFIASSAALVAMAIDPRARAGWFLAHQSAENAHRLMVERLALRPMVHLEMRLGEGTAAAIGIGLIETALKLYHEMATFQDLV
jgi:nicotinate-nucleotide--dimethylbenzimidazole phosphoribosyltransferase